MGPWPGLAPEVANVANLEPDLLVNLASHRFFERLAWFHEAGQHTVEPVGEGAIARQQKLFAALDEHDHRRTQPRKAEQTALRTELGPLGRRVDGGLSTAPAEAVRFVPGQDLDRATRDRVQVVGKPTIQ